MKFELSKKFSIKGLIGVSAVALAMIGAGGAINANNNNVHADDTSAADAMFNNPSIMKDSEEDEKASNESEHEENEAAKPQRKQEAKEEMQNGFLDRDFYKDPTIHHYLHKLGYSNHQIKKGVNVDEGDNTNNDVHYGSKAENNLARKADEANKALARHHSADVTIGGGTHARNSGHRHLSSRTVRGIESTVAKDERAIKRDEKKLNTKSGRAFERNMSYYKDLQSRKASLRGVVRSHHASKSAKRHARKLLRSLNKKAPRQKKMAKGLIAYYVRTSKNLNASKANLKKIAKAKRTPKNVKKYINNFLKSLNKKSTKKSHKVTKNYKKSAKRIRA